jgi:hypothetical protein
MFPPHSDAERRFSRATGRYGMGEGERQRDPEQAADEIREKIERGDEPSEDEAAFLESERVELESDEPTRTSSDLTG